MRKMPTRFPYTFRIAHCCRLLLAIAMAVSSALAGAADTPNRDVPSSHAALYKKLNSRVSLNFEKSSFEKIRSSLAASLQAKIEFDREEFNDAGIPEEMSLVLEHPITHKSAIRMLLHSAGLYDRQITLREGGVWIVGPKAAKDRPVLMTHNLRSVSNYSTVLRSRFIDRVRREIAPHSWSKREDAWIVPAASVFSVDVYHTPEVQNKIIEFWQKEYLGVDDRNVVLRDVFGRGSDAWGQKMSAEEIASHARKLREEYPFQSLAKRLSYEKGKAAPPAVKPAEPSSEPDEKELAIMRVRTGYFASLRARSLENLHSTEVEKFISREGFGVSRMPEPSPSFLPLPEVPRLALPSAEVDPPQAGPPVRIPMSPAEANVASVDLPSHDVLEKYHTASGGAFLATNRFGYIKDRDHVSGFAPHAFASLPRVEDGYGWSADPAEQWALRRLELVSLLKHETPRVYVSDALPRMDKLAEARTRRLDDFEAVALKRLGDGEDVVTHASLNRIEMLGALRATETCLQCHEVAEGQMLGAFSYSLVRDPWIEVGE